MEEIIVRYIHFIGIILLSSSLVSEHLLIRPSLDKASFKRLAIIDSIYGLSAVITLVAGLLLWFAVGKPASFYTSNPVFHIKMTLFIVIGIISIFPTLFFRKNRKSIDNEIAMPKYIVLLIRIQLTGLIIMPLLGVFVGRGVGIN